MKELRIEATEDTPEIIFDKNEKTFNVVGKSLPENAIDFYKPVIEWVKNYETDPLNDSVFCFKFEYFNTASAKQIAKLLKILEKINKEQTVKIKWYYKKIDTDMHASGVRYSKLIQLSFELIDYE